MKFASQSDYPVRFEWGLDGVMQVANGGGVAIVVDVLSFSTCVDIACARGAQVLPYRFKDAGAEAFAQANGAVLASRRGSEGLSLSPKSLLGIEPGTKLVLPSPNGSTLSLACTTPVVIAGCLRNAASVAAFAARQTGPITLIAAGERWEDGSLRPASEDLIGAGAIIHAIAAEKSPEATIAEAAFVGVRERLLQVVKACASGIELISKGFPEDVNLAAQLNASECVPVLVSGNYISAEG